MPDTHRDDIAESSVAYRALGAATEAQGAIRSHERLNDLQFIGIEKTFSAMKHDFDSQFKELKELIQNTDQKIDLGFKNYDSKFWSLAVALIAILMAICGFLLVYTLFPGTHHG